MKYKLWDKNEKEFIENGWVIFPNGDLYWTVYGDIVDKVCMKDYILIKSSEIKDINNQEVYEGDIIKTLRNLSYYEYGVVKYKEGSWRIYTTESEFYLLKPTLGGIYTNEIIGSMFKNKIDDFE